MNTLDVQYPQILDECITHLQDGLMTYEGCLAKYPVYAEQLQHDLAIVQLTQRISVPQLKSQSVDAIEAKLLKQFNRGSTQSKRPTQTKQSQPTRIQPMRQSYLRWVAGFVIAFMLLMGAGGGTVYASSTSLPGETLYSVKIAWEQVIVLISTFFNNQDEVWLHLTQTRANEILVLYENGRLTDDVLDTFYTTAETAILYATDDTEQAYIDLVEGLHPVFSEAILLSTNEMQRFRILRILSPEMDANGHLILPDGEELLPQPDDNEAATLEPTMILTATPTLTQTAILTATPTFTLTYTPTMTSEPTQTRTPTPSRTPTLLPSITPTLTLTSTPTATWTPLGIQPRSEQATSVNNSGQQIKITEVKATKPFTVDNDEIFVRETERAVEITQTAIAKTPSP